MLPASNRLKNKKDFELIFKKGKGFKENFLYLKVAANKLKNTRFGFIITKKYSKSAVSRNRTKRQLREAVKIYLPKIKKGFDCAIVVIPGFAINDFWELSDIVEKLFKKAGLLER